MLDCFATETHEQGRLSDLPRDARPRAGRLPSCPSCSPRHYFIVNVNNDISSIHNSTIIIIIIIISIIALLVRLAALPDHTMLCVYMYICMYVYAYIYIYIYIYT